jgi:hypothetical protein
LSFAAEQDRAIYSHNIQDFSFLATQWAEQGRPHNGIIVSKLDFPGRLEKGFDLLFEQYPGGIEGLFLWLPSVK